MEKELKIETAKSICPTPEKEQEYSELLQTKRNNQIKNDIDIDFTDKK